MIVRNIIHLEVGEPDFDIPECIKEAGIRAIREGRTRYSHSLGLLELREAICEDYEREYGVHLSPDQIIVTSGTSPAMFLLFAAFLHGGDDVKLPLLVPRQSGVFLLGLLDQDDRGQFWPIVKPQLLRIITPGGNPVQKTFHTQSRKIYVNINTQTLAIEIIYHVERPETPAAPQSIAHEISRPALVHLLRHGKRLRVPIRQPSLPFAPHVELQSTVNTMYTLVIPSVTLPTKKLKQFGESVPWMILNKAQENIDHRLVPLGIRPVLIDCTA